jgi:hypothetical protein
MATPAPAPIKFKGYENCTVVEQTASLTTFFNPATEAKVTVPTAKLKVATPKHIKGEFSSNALVLAEISVSEVVKAYAETGAPQEAGSSRWARRVYTVLGTPIDQWTSAPTTLPQYLVKDGYLIPAPNGGYIPTGKPWSGLSNKYSK